MSAAAALANIKDLVSVTYNIPGNLGRETWTLQDWDSLLLMGPSGRDLIVKQLQVGAGCPIGSTYELHYTLDIPLSENSTWHWGPAKGLLADLVDAREFVGPGAFPDSV